MSERLTLLPCPFCGSSAEGDTGFFPLTNLLYVWCSNAECGCSPKGRGERMFLPEEWNHRAALRSPQPAEQQEAVAWTTELALETAKQIGSIGFTVCPENIWGDKGVALTRVRAAQPAEQQEAGARIVDSNYERQLLNEWYDLGPGDPTNRQLVEHGHVDDGLLVHLIDFVIGKSVAHPPSVAPREAQQAKPIAWNIWWDNEKWLLTSHSDDYEAARSRGWTIIPLYAHSTSVAPREAKPSEGAQRDAERCTCPRSCIVTGRCTCGCESCKREATAIAALSRRPA